MKVTPGQLRRLRALAGLPDGAEADMDVVLALVTAKVEAAAARRGMASGPDRRERVIAAAVKAGKFKQSRVDHYRRLWAADPEGTERLIGVLAELPELSGPAEAGDFSAMFPPGHELNPTSRRGDELPDEMAALFPAGHELNPAGPGSQHAEELDAAARRDAERVAAAAAGEPAEGGLTEDEWRRLFGPNYPR
jgi:hypothetical protein